MQARATERTYLHMHARPSAFMRTCQERERARETSRWLSSCACGCVRFVGCIDHHLQAGITDGIPSETEAGKICEALEGARQLAPAHMHCHNLEPAMNLAVDAWVGSACIRCGWLRRCAQGTHPPARRRPKPPRARVRKPAPRAQALRAWHRFGQPSDAKRLPCRDKWLR